MTEEFTESVYSQILQRACAKFKFVDVCEVIGEEGECIWRHDVDASPYRAKRLAQIDISHGVKSHFYFMFGSRFYNLFEPAIVRVIREIVAMGHHVGLHYDVSGEPIGYTSFRESFLYKVKLLQLLIGAEVKSFSIHDPGTLGQQDLLEGDVLGVRNVSSKTFMHNFTYCSDSNGIWRFRHILDVINDSNTKRLCALTHPEWWTPSPMPAIGRINRCVSGRAKRVLMEYEEDLLHQGRSHN